MTHYSPNGKCQYWSAKFPNQTKFVPMGGWKCNAVCIFFFFNLFILNKESVMNLYLNRNSTCLFRWSKLSNVFIPLCYCTEAVWNFLVSDMILVALILTFSINFCLINIQNLTKKVYLKILENKRGRFCKISSGNWDQRLCSFLLYFFLLTLLAFPFLFFLCRWG